MNRKELENQLEELKERLKNTYALDFVNDYKLNNSSYICDAFAEFADSQTSIYYRDQREYFHNNTEACENALLELYDNESLATLIRKEGLEGLICKAGAIGEYKAIESELYDELENIIKYLVIEYLLVNNDLIGKIVNLDDFVSQYDQSNQLDEIQADLEELKEEY